MKIKSNQVILIVATFLGVYILIAGYLSISKPFDIKIENENKVVSEIPPQIGAKPLSGEYNQIKSEIAPKTESKDLSEEVNNISVSFQFIDKKYELEISENSSVFDAMKDLQNKVENNFNFKYREYSNMGAFIYEINGMKGKSGAYWIYYINGKEASVGVSSYLLKEGDSILWKQE